METIKNKTKNKNTIIKTKINKRNYKNKNEN